MQGRSGKHANRWSSSEELAHCGATKNATKASTTPLRGDFGADFFANGAAGSKKLSGYLVKREEGRGKLASSER